MSTRQTRFLTLAESLKTKRLQEFIAQEEALGVGPIDPQNFEAAVKKIITQPQSKGRTSRSASRGGLRGK